MWNLMMLEGDEGRAAMKSRKSEGEDLAGRPVAPSDLPTRRDMLALVGAGAGLLVSGMPAADRTEIVIVDGWILSPADLVRA